jgi:hypothetical protein
LSSATLPLTSKHESREFQAVTFLPAKEMLIGQLPKQTVVNSAISR